MSTQTPSFSTPPSVAAQIARLPEMPMAEIRALWQKLVGGEAPTHNRQFLERRIAYRLQELEFRKVDANLLDRNKRRIASLVETGKVRKRDRDYRPAAGTVLVREYKVVEYRVITTADGQYDFQGRMFPSLSMIAREITGMRWSGPLFFGLRPPSNARTKASSKKRSGQRARYGSAGCAARSIREKPPTRCCTSNTTPLMPSAKRLMPIPPVNAPRAGYP